jgi:hypothetical protein
VGIAGVVEHPEEIVQTDVDAGRLYQRVIERVDTESSGCNLGANVTI